MHVLTEVGPTTAGAEGILHSVLIVVGCPFVSDSKKLFISKHVAVAPILWCI